MRRTTLRVQVLGPLHVERDAVEVDLGSPKQRAVLAMFVSNPSASVSRDGIIDGVWGEEASEANRRSFHTYLSNLRGILGHVIVRVGDTYRLEVDGDDIDSVVFARTVEEARRLVATDPQAVAQSLRQALGMWRGRPYADLEDVAGLQSEIRRLEELRLEAVELRIDAELAAGLHGTLIAELEALAEEHPFREHFRAQHMLALYRSGRQGDALRAYRRTESLLAEQLGVNPSQELQDLELAILEHDESLLGGPARAVTQRLAFLVTEIEASSLLWDRHPQGMADALATHDRVLSDAIESEGGRLFKRTEEGVLAAFPDPGAAVRAVEAAQRNLADAEWGEVGELRVRMGVDVGEAEARGGEFSGPPLNRAAKLCAVSHGGQTLVSPAVQGELAAAASPGVQIRQLGEYRLVGMAGSEPVAQLVFDGLPADFPDLRTNASLALDDRIEIVSLPGYEIRDRIGEGAFGVVWRAYQPSVGREVAVKAIRPELATQPSFVRRFEAEARTIVRLAHPHMVPLIDFWRDTESAYLVLGLLTGGSLGEAMRSGDVDRVEARRVLGQIGAALDHAHSLGMAHGDLKPANVLLDEAGNAYLSDFGIAARLLYPDVMSSMSSEPAYRAPEEMETGPTPAGDLFALGVLARELLDGGPEIDAISGQATAFAPDDRYESAAAFLADLDDAFGEAPARVERRMVTRNPYKGLRPFEEGDVADFYGRDQLVATMLTAVAEHRFVTVTGPSGSGKSSAVQAGLAPALAGGAIEGSDKWFRVLITPGRDPLAALAQGLESVSTEVVTSDDLARDGLASIVDGELLVVVDQFEELYTLADVSQQRKTFVDVIADAVEAPESRVRVVATLRADFYDRPLEDPRLGTLVRDGLVTVLPPAREELVEMIAAPANAVGLRWEPDLPHRIADDIVGQPGGLPLLQYALTEVVERRSGDLLTAGDYKRMGGVSGALSNRAEAVFTQLTPSQQRATRQVMLRLVNVDEDNDDTRRRVRRSELESVGIPRPDLDTVLDSLISQRLLLADRDPATRGPTVEVAHEALLREWPRLRGWVDDQREALILGRRFRTALAEWESNDHHPDYLLTGNRLAPYAGWAETSSLTSIEVEYYEASKGKDEEERNARRRRRRTLTGILATAAAVATTLGVVAVVQAERATEQAQVARARELSAAAVVALESDPRLAKLLAVAAAELAQPTSDGLSVLHQADASDRVIDRYAWPADRETAAFGADLHPEGTRLVASDDPEIPPFGPTPRYLEVFDFETESVLWSWETQDPTVGLAKARYSTDGAWVIAGTYRAPEEGTEGDDPPSDLLGLHLWDADTGELLRRIDLGRCGGWIESVSAQFVLVSTTDPEDCSPPPPLSLEVVDLESGERRQLSPDFVPPANLTGDGALAAFTDVSDQVFRSVVVDIVNGRRVFDENTGDATWLVNQDGSLIVAGLFPTQIWDVAEGRLVATFAGHQGEVLNWDFGSDGETVLSVGREGTLRLWNARTGTEITKYPAIGNGRVSTTMDGRVLVADWTSQRASLLDLTLGEVWGVDTCPGRAIADTLQVVDGTALLSAACASGEFPTFVIDTSERAVVAEYPGHAGQDVRVSPDATRFVRQILVEPPEGAEGLWVGPPVIADLRTGTSLVELDGVCSWEWFTVGPYDGCVEAPKTPFSMFNWRFEWSPDSSLVAAFNHHGGNIVVWDAETGELLGQIESCLGLYFMFNDDASQLWEDCAGDLVVVSTETWEAIRTVELPIEENRFGFLGYDADRTSLLLVGGALGQGTGSLHWIDVETLAIEHSIHDAHDGSPKSWAMSPDRSRAATGASDGWVKVWDVEGRRLEQGFRISTQVQGVAFIDDDHLAVAPETGGIYVYTLDPDELQDIVRVSLTRGFTPLECEQFNFGDDCPTLEELRDAGR